MKSLRLSIREIVQDAEAPMTVGEIHGKLDRTVSRKAVAVTVYQMCDARQLRKRKAPKGSRVQGTRYVYTSGPEIVVDKHGGREHHKTMKGFMELARERKRKAGRAAA